MHTRESSMIIFQKKERESSMIHPSQSIHKMRIIFRQFRDLVFRTISAPYARLVFLRFFHPQSFCRNKRRCDPELAMEFLHFGLQHVAEQSMKRGTGEERN
jgi:hypothetical protein